MPRKTVLFISIEIVQFQMKLFLHDCYTFFRTTPDNLAFIASKMTFLSFFSLNFADANNKVSGFSDGQKKCYVRQYENSPGKKFGGRLICIAPSRKCYSHSNRRWSPLATKSLISAPLFYKLLRTKSNFGKMLLKNAFEKLTYRKAKVTVKKHIRFFKEKKPLWIVDLSNSRQY